jgi:P27 family predicted phage terminase small subunit
MSVTALDGGDGTPPEPDWSEIYADPLDLAFAAEQWGAIIREMRDRGILAVANGHAVKRLVEFRVQYERAAKYLAEHGPVVKAKRTGVPQINPHWTIMRQADEAVARAEAELGLAPVRRQKAAKVERKARQTRAADAYLKAANSV